MIEINIIVRDKFFKQVNIAVLKEQPSQSRHSINNDDCYNNYLGFKINGKKKKKSNNKCGIH